MNVTRDRAPPSSGSTTMLALGRIGPPAPRTAQVRGRSAAVTSWTIECSARGARAAGKGALAFTERARHAYPVAGLLASRQGRPVAVMAFTVRHRLIAQIDVRADARRLGRSLDRQVVGG